MHTQSMERQAAHLIRPPQTPVQKSAGPAQTPNRKLALLIDSDPAVTQVLAQYIRLQEFEVVTASHSAEARKALARLQHIDIVVLDVRLPDGDGFSFARSLRTSTDIPIILLSGLARTPDRIIGLELGADDYITKPFDLREVYLRMRAVMRRAEGPRRARPGAVKTAKHEVAFGSGILDMRSHRFYASDGRQVPITAMEYDLLRTFAENPDVVLSRDRLLDLTRDHGDGGEEPFDRSIDIRVARLRRKIETNPSKPTIIKTVRGAGYIFIS